MRFEQIYEYKDRRFPTNVGDTISNTLLNKMGINVPTTHDMNASNKLLSVGSVIQMAYRPGDIIWGSGIIAREHRVQIDDPDALVAVRGPKTLNNIDGDKSSRVAFGDPALLCPLYVKSPKRQRNKLGALPHWVDQTSWMYQKEAAKSDGILLIDIGSPLEEIVDKLAECHTVITSSLHGIVLAEAYGVPNVHWVLSPTGLVTGGMWKFLDYFLGTGRQVFSPGAIPPLDKNDLAYIQINLTKAFERIL